MNYGSMEVKATMSSTGDGLKSDEDKIHNNLLAVRLQTEVKEETKKDIQWVIQNDTHAVC